MKANELRLGNLLQDKLTKSFLIVTDLSENAITTKDIDSTNYPLNRWRVAEPIPLTPEILVKAGFVKSINFDNTYIKLIKGESFILKDCKDGTFFVYTGIRCQYLHQLQNLYFALTGEELNIFL